MDRLHRLIQYINTQLGVLSVSQRAAIGLCAALIVTSVLWLLTWSSSPDLVPIVRHDFSYADLDSAEEAMRVNGITHEVRGTRLYVKASERHNALRLLHSAGALPEGSLFDMESVVTNQNPFQSPEARAYAQNYAMGNELAKIIATSPYVRQASVLINPRTRRKLGGQSDEPTASVSVTLSAGTDMSADMVEGFAKLVSGAVAGLKPHRVNVTDAGSMRTYNVPHPDDTVSFDYLRLVKQREEHLRDKILAKLSYVPSVQAAVTVELDTSRTVTQKLQHDRPQLKSEQTNSSENTDATQSAEPGVQPNLGQSVSASAAGQSSTTEESTTENFAPLLTQQETIEQMPYATKSVTAAIGIPRSFIAGVFKARFPQKGEPKDDDADFVTTRDEQVARVKNSVERIIMAANPDDVAVDVYPDMEWSSEGGSWSRVPGGETMQAGAETGGFDLVRTYVPQIGLVLLALASMFMMVRIVKAAPVEDPTTFETPMGEEESSQVLPAGEQAVGQAVVSEGTLIGHELDSSTLRFREIGGEVSELVKEDPQSAAELIRRWIEE